MSQKRMVRWTKDPISEAEGRNQSVMLTSLVPSDPSCREIHPSRTRLPFRIPTNPSRMLAHACSQSLGDAKPIKAIGRRKRRAETSPGHLP